MAGFEVAGEKTEDGGGLQGCSPRSETDSADPLPG